MIPTIVIIVGITGDLAQRKLLPAIGQMASLGALPESFRLVGITRRADVDLDALISQSANQAYLREHTELFQMSLTEADGYDRLTIYLNQLEAQLGGEAQRLFYLSVPPHVSSPIIELLGRSGLSNVPRTKLLLEKPFGVDLASAKELVEHIERYFLSEQVYRIDHYLAKGAAQNILVFRDGNSLFKRTWNKDFIEKIEIIASEAIGIEGRAIFYEQTGALRDLIQSHLLQLAALTLMKLPSTDRLDLVPSCRYEALKQLSVPLDRPMAESVKRGQYTGYQEEAGNQGSMVETFASVTIQSSAPEWFGVPIMLTTGKALDRKYTEVRISYKKEQGHEANELVLRLQPDEGVELCLWAKKPGYAHQLSRHALHFAFKEHYSTLPEAYEQVLFDAMNSDHRLFASSEEVLETWRILDPIQKSWGMSNKDLRFYESGTGAGEV